MQLDLAKNRLASKAARCVGRGKAGGRGGESHLSVWTMGVVVNEFSSQLIRQPYFSRISSRSSSEGPCSPGSCSVQEVPMAQATLLLRGSNVLRAEHAQLPLGNNLFFRARRPGNPLWKVG